MPGANYYRVLGVPKNATSSQIKTSYKTLAKKFHPDLNGGDTKQMVAINEAYQVLSNPSKRYEYNQTLERAKAKSRVQQDADGFVYTPHKPRKPATRHASQPHRAYARSSRPAAPKANSKSASRLAWAAVIAIVIGLLLGMSMRSPAQDGTTTTGTTPTVTPNTTLHDTPATSTPNNVSPNSSSSDTSTQNDTTLNNDESTQTTPRNCSSNRLSFRRNAYCNNNQSTDCSANAFEENYDGC